MTPQMNQVTICDNNLTDRFDFIESQAMVSVEKMKLRDLLNDFMNKSGSYIY